MPQKTQRLERGFAVGHTGTSSAGSHRELTYVEVVCVACNEDLSGLAWVLRFGEPIHVHCEEKKNAPMLVPQVQGRKPGNRRHARVA